MHWASHIAKGLEAAEGFLTGLSSDEAFFAKIVFLPGGAEPTFVIFYPVEDVPPAEGAP